MSGVRLHAGICVCGRLRIIGGCVKHRNVAILVVPPGDVIKTRPIVEGKTRIYPPGVLSIEVKALVDHVGHDILAGLVETTNLADQQIGKLGAGASVAVKDEWIVASVRYCEFAPISSPLEFRVHFNSTATDTGFALLTSKSVSTMILAFGDIARISRIASTPLRSGSLKSISVRSGCDALNIRTASLAVPACPITCMPGCDPNPHNRIIVHDQDPDLADTAFHASAPSAIGSIALCSHPPFGSMEQQPNRSSSPHLGDQLEPPAESLHALSHTNQSIMPGLSHVDAAGYESATFARNRNCYISIP